MKGCIGQLVVGLANAVKVIYWDGVSPTARVLRTLFTAEQNSISHFNYGLVDAKGRLFAGTFNHKTIACSVLPNYGLYLYSKQGKLGKLHQLIKNSRSTTGLAINRKEKKLYYADACAYKIDEYDYDPETGAICKNYII